MEFKEIEGLKPKLSNGLKTIDGIVWAKNKSSFNTYETGLYLPKGIKIKSLDETKDIILKPSTINAKLKTEIENSANGDFYTLKRLLETKDGERHYDKTKIGEVAIFAYNSPKESSFKENKKFSSQNGFTSISLNGNIGGFGEKDEYGIYRTKVAYFDDKGLNLAIYRKRWQSR